MISDIKFNYIFFKIKNTYRRLWWSFMNDLWFWLVDLWSWNILWICSKNLTLIFALFFIFFAISNRKNNYSSSFIRSKGLIGTLTDNKWPCDSIFSPLLKEPLELVENIAWWSTILILQKVYLYVSILIRFQKVSYI